MSPSPGRTGGLAASTLYLVATPIGNLEDVSARALRVLGAATMVAAEDTRHTLKLLTHFGIRPARLVSCFEHNEARRVPEILETLRGGGAVALVTDAGMPGVSDPGDQVVKAVLAEGFAVVPVPGPSAVLAALTASGFPATPFLFAGFLPAKAPERRTALLRLRSEEATLVFYESPHRLRDSLKDMMNVFGNRRGVAARELTKVHEEFVRGTLQELWKAFKTGEARGEFTLVVEGAEHREHSRSEDWAGVSIADQLTQMMTEHGLSKTEAVKAVCHLRDLPREVVYRIATQLPASGGTDRDGEGKPT
jgi:16S rRNA (cytidine1402-2'-O)-methyltransferase